MSNGNRDGQSDQDGEAAPRRTHHTLAFAAVGAFVLFVVVLLPFTLTSVVTDIASPPSQHVYELTPDGAASSSATYMHLNVVGVDEWQGTVTLRVSGQHTCAAPCSWDDVVLFVSVPPGRVAGRGLPPAEQVRFPALRSQPVNVTIVLPVDGEPVRYPFDRYQFTLGVLLRFENPDGSDVPVQVASAQGDGQRLFASLRMAAPRMTISTPLAIDRTGIDPAVPSLPYDLTVRMTFSRPLYLRVLSVLLVLLITAAAGSRMMPRPNFPAPSLSITPAASVSPHRTCR